MTGDRESVDTFLRYAAVKYLGANRRVLIAAASGGLVLSTAVTLANARRAATVQGSPRLLAAGVAAATAVPFLRVFAIAAAKQPRLLIFIGPALIAAAVVAVGFALVSTFGGWTAWANSGRSNAVIPSDFWSVIGFAIFLGAIIDRSSALTLDIFPHLHRGVLRRWPSAMAAFDLISRRFEDQNRNVSHRCN